ncbi:PorP/SprF family type IX secretion system membrane protein [Wenyingzhuangia sp. IMCC45533]
MNKIYLVLLLVFVFSIKTYSQQDPHYTMYMYNMNIVNPAYAGSTKHLNISVLGREQWVGIEGAPSTYTANIHSRIGKGFGLGVSLITDKIGPQSENSLFADLSYTFPVSRTGNLSFGLKLGGSAFSIDRITESNDSDSTLDGGRTELFPNTGAGALYHTDIFYVGLSVPNFLRADHINDDDTSEAEEVEHIFFTSGYVFQAKDYLKIKPSTLVKFAPGTPVSIDLSLNFLFYDKFEFGISNRLDDAWAGTFNFQATDAIRLGYAYDYTTSELNEFSRGSHEFFILYKIPLSARNIKSPRFF